MQIYLATILELNKKNKYKHYNLRDSLRLNFNQLLIITYYTF